MTQSDSRGPTPGAAAAADISVQVFRQTMLLPLALDRWEESGKLGWWLDCHMLETVGFLRNKKSPWREVLPDRRRKRAVRRHVEPSRAFRAAGLCQSYATAEAPVLLRADEAPVPGAGAAVEDAETYSRRWAYAEAAYFHPFVQRFLFGGADGGKNKGRGAGSLRLLRRDDIAFLRVEIGYSDGIRAGDVRRAGEVRYDAFAIELIVERCDLYVLEKPGLLCLLVEVAATARSEIRLMRAVDPRQDRPQADARRLGGRDYRQTEDTKPITLVEAQILHDGLRRLYPPFFREPDAPVDGEGRTGDRAAHDMGLFPGCVTLLDDKRAAIADTPFDGAAAGAAIGDLVDHSCLPVAPWWRQILAPVALDRVARERAAPSTPRWRQVVDDRMPTVVFLAVEDSAAIARPDLIRLCFADQPGSGLPYAAEFLQRFEELHCYDRFRHFGTRYMASSYSFVCVVGTGATFPPKTSSFALDVTQEHMRRHYTYMVLLTHMQRAALLAFSRWMSEAMREGGNLRDSRYRYAMGGIRTALAEFAQRSWFTNVSNQEQARELFDLLLSRTGTMDIYREVMQESATIRDELAGIAEERQQASAMSLNVLVALGAALATPIGFAQGFAALSDDRLKLTPFWFFADLAAACVAAGVAIVVVATLQLEGRIEGRELSNTLWRVHRGRSLHRMRRIVRAVAIGLALAAGWFGYRAWQEWPAPIAAGAVCVVANELTPPCPP